MFLADVAYNKRLSFHVEALELVETSIEELSEEAKVAHDEMLQMDDDEFISIDSSNYEDYKGLLT